MRASKARKSTVERDSTDPRDGFFPRRWQVLIIVRRGREKCGGQFRAHAKTTIWETGGRKVDRYYFQYPKCPVSVISTYNMVLLSKMHQN
jgi:hypothetical protein